MTVSKSRPSFDESRPGDIFQNQPARFEGVDDVHGVEEEAGSLAAKSRAAAHC